MDSNILEGVYQLGDCLGKGAFGSVYRGIEIHTGQCIAVKKIKINAAKKELNAIRAEIKLLKCLRHPNIVAYKESFESSKEFSIVLELCENGSLLHIWKRFGKFPEVLLARYMQQVLSGLEYLHQQGVIHRDVKAANILTTKDGVIKLADFGLASKIGDLKDQEIEGSPYWMAPEVIELSGARTVSDIWSLGCTIIELIQGKPPYFDMSPMQALFRIVQDDQPPFPEEISFALGEFLTECFQRDVNFRSDASKLLHHKWFIVQAKGTNKNALSFDDQIQDITNYNTIRRTRGIKKRSQNVHKDENDDIWDDDFDIDGGSLKKVIGNPTKDNSRPVNDIKSYVESDEDDCYSGDFEQDQNYNMTIVEHTNGSVEEFELYLSSENEDAGSDKAVEREMEVRAKEKAAKLFEQLSQKKSSEEYRGIFESLISIFDSYHGLRNSSLVMNNVFSLVQFPRENPSDAGECLILLSILAKGNPVVQDHICAVGGIPMVLSCNAMNSPQAPSTIVRFFDAVLGNNGAFQTFISCNGLPVLTSFLDHEFGKNETLVYNVIRMVANLFKLQSGTTKKYLSHLLVNTGCLHRLSEILPELLSSPDTKAIETAAKIIGIFHILSNGDKFTKQAMADPIVLECILNQLHHMPPFLLVNALKCIHCVSQLPQSLSLLVKLNVIEELLLLLEFETGSFIVEMHTHIFSSIYNICKLNKPQLEKAALLGCVPYLRNLVVENNPLKQFALPILLEMTHAGKRCCAILSQEKCLQLFLDLLLDPCWQTNSMESLFAWMQGCAGDLESENIEMKLADDHVLSIITSAVIDSSTSQSETLLPAFIRILEGSDMITESASQSGPFIQWMMHAIPGQEYPTVVKISLCKALDKIMSFHNHPPAQIGTLAHYLMNHDSVILKGFGEKFFPLVQ